MKNTERVQIDIEDDGPAEGSTCILAGAFGVVMFFVLIGVALWMVNK